MIKEYPKQKIKEYNLNPSVCKFCNFSLSYNKRKNKFCNHSCSASFNNKGIARNFTTGEWKKKKCKNCDKITENSKYCSHKCSGEFEWKKRKKIIEQTKEASSHREGKKYLLDTKDNKCQLCGILKWKKKKLVLILDHFDGNSNNNLISNLRLICPNCDSQLPTYKNKNKGNGRYIRRQRYIEGKSY